ncbi:hypothetical protein TWF679_005784 [Orbilia oligospora]|uniref:Uncharacterized protein n=1 Tax=Orbilia oligospora TaxID=2813651 RepID=A0A8H8VBC2_ORBOL|nr:hypothetical protein TWF679_005784 [Orbilia oligospora]
MREPSLHRIVQCVRKNFIHCRRRPIHTTSQRFFRIEASNVKPTSDGDGAGNRPHQYTKIQASVIERSPDRRKLSRILLSLGTKSQPRRWEFSKRNIQLALEDLQVEDPPVRISLLAPEDVSRMMRQALRSKFYNVFSRETKGGIEVVPFAPALQGSKEPTLDPGKIAKLGAVLPFTVENRQLFIYVGDLRTPIEDSLVDPLLPYGPLLQGDEREFWPVHRAFLIDKNPIRTKHDLVLLAKKAKLPIEIIHDIPFKRLQEEPSGSGEAEEHRISTEGAFLALKHLGTAMDPSAYKAATLSDEWRQSGITDVISLLLTAAGRRDQCSDHIPLHVRDSLAGLLSTDILERCRVVDFDTYFGELETTKKEWINEEVKKALLEILNDIGSLTIQNGRPNPFTVHPQTRKIRHSIESGILSTSEIRFQELYYLFNKCQSSESSGDSSPSPEYQFFPKFRSQILQLGESLSSHVRNHRWDFFSSCGWGAAATGLLINYSIDPTIALSIFALIVAVSLKRFRSETRELWYSYEKQSAIMARKLLDDLNTFFMRYTIPDRETDLKRYEMDMEEILLIRKEVSEARELLLKLAPSLRSQFPEWQSPSPSPEETRSSEETRS